MISVKLSWLASACIYNSVSKLRQGDYKYTKFSNSTKFSKLHEQVGGGGAHPLLPLIAAKSQKRQRHSAATAAFNHVSGNISKSNCGEHFLKLVLNCCVSGP